MPTKMTAKDFFLHLAVIVLLYSGVVALLNILFRVINVAFPQVTQYNNFISTSISLPVATIIVVFPLFLIIANILQKSYAEDPLRREYAVRKWLVYITLFIAGGVMAGDLITLIYFFLDGQELTTAFILKIVSVLVVVGCVFGYYMDDLKGRLDTSRRMLWRAVSLALVVGSIGLGFNVLGTPMNQRLLRYDSQKVSDLQNIQYQVVNYWQQKGSLPTTLKQLEDPISGFILPLDPQNKSEYEYERINTLSFNLCATFSKPSPQNNFSTSRVPVFAPEGKFGIADTWQHDAGKQCFSRTIDPDLYPVRPKI